MMLLAGTSRAVVPVPPGTPGLPRAAALAAGAGAAAAACPAALAAAPDEVAALLALSAEHPARNMPPPIRTLPIMRPATAPGLVRPDRARRRVKLRVFRMPL